MTTAQIAPRETIGRTDPRERIVHPQEWPVYDDFALAEVLELLAHGRSFDYDYGDEIAALEAAFAVYHGRRHALATASGTAALLAAYYALGLAPGDEVIVSDFTFFSTATPLFLLGAVPVLCDAGDERGNVAVDGVAELVTERTAAIAVTHLWGHPCDLGGLRKLADARGLALLEDCSHAHGSTYRSRPVGCAGDVAVYSLGGRKMVSGGMGGMLLTDDEDVYARACLLANFRHRTDLTISAPDYEPFLITGLGGNFRISPVAAVLAKSHFDALGELVETRLANLSALVDGLSALEGIEAIPVDDACTTGASYDTNVVVDPSCPFTRDELAARLQDEGLKVRAPATKPLHRFPIFQGAAPAWSPTSAAAVAAAATANARPFPVAERLFGQWLKLPVNFLWDASGTIVEPYLNVCEEVLGPTGPRER
ncbi:MAG TPA: aminotransferase class I/II-fold pyridoxal phosphate-dependent enzyme [Gaiellaceae bacterium]